MKLRATLPLLALLLVACAGNTPLPDEHYYRLAIAPTGGSIAGLQGVVQVEAPRAPDVYASRAITYSEDAENISLQHYHYHFWIDPPPRLLQQELLRYLREAAPRATVVTETSAEAVEYRVRGSLRRFERIKTAQGWKVSVALQLSVDGKDGSPLLAKDYEQTLPATDAKLESSVQAFSVATSGIFSQFTRDLEKALPRE